ncbi:uncharacterized protein LOC133036256 [Cannabis sativa]|uniref:uncharacterized protein LOC133036256 n=1 Tax=Cannabis sativa TaxID=3483 RepID=UPI0029C9DE6B|nr:uncharacterized protein LOC133036256 [Cannabis sativa]
MEPLYKRFLKQAPPVFLGGPDVMKDEQWLTMIERILNFMGVDVTIITWKEFKELFNAKYYNEVVRSAKRKEFTELMQTKGMSVTEYTTKFDRLAKLVMGILPTDFSKKEKYLTDLNVKIKHDLVITTNQATTFAEMVEKALRAEGVVKFLQEPQVTPNVGGTPTFPTPAYGRDGGDSTTDQKRKVTPASNGSMQSKWFRRNQGRGGGQGYSYHECLRCKKHHPRECNWKTCFQCGMVGHFKKDCPQAKKEEQKSEARPVPARVFPITQGNAAVSPSMVTGQLLINNSLYIVLFDSGATRSYVATRVIDL